MGTFIQQSEYHTAAPGNVDSESQKNQRQVSILSVHVSGIQLNIH